MAIFTCSYVLNHKAITAQREVAFRLETWCLGHATHIAEHADDAGCVYQSLVAIIHALDDAEPLGFFVMPQGREPNALPFRLLDNPRPPKAIKL